MPFDRPTKYERALAFARENGEGKPVMYPPEPQADWRVSYDWGQLSEKKSLEGWHMTYTVELLYELFRPWPHCPWSWPGGAWRVTLTEIYDRADLDALYGGKWGRPFTDFSVCSDFCETREAALASARLEMRTTPTF